MFINYRGTNVHALGYVQMKNKTLRNRRTGKIRVVQEVASQSPQDIVWLRPGWNEFPKMVWEQNKNHPQVLHMIKKKQIILLEEKVTVLEKDKNGRKKKITKVLGQDDSEILLRDFSEARAIEIVKETLNRDILQRWLDEEMRHRVKRSIAKQIKPLLNPQKDEDENEDF